MSQSVERDQRGTIQWVATAGCMLALANACVLGLYLTSKMSLADRYGATSVGDDVVFVLYCSIATSLTTAVIGWLLLRGDSNAARWLSSIALIANLAVQLAWIVLNLGGRVQSYTSLVGKH